MHEYGTQVAQLSGKPKYLEKNLSQWHFVHSKSHMV